MRKFMKNDEGFTGLEAAIVLIAFVVVAAVFSYVMLGAGFFTTQKSQETVHTSVSQASSNVEVCGAVVGQGGADEKLGYVTMYLQLAAGGTPVDMNKTTFAISTSDVKPFAVTWDTGDSKLQGHSFLNGNGNDMLELGELAKLNFSMSDAKIIPNEQFEIEIKPPIGAAYPVARTAPPEITEGNIYEMW